MNWYDLIIITLACWRIANLLADDDQSGPFEILHKLRHFLGVKYTPDSLPFAKSGSIGDMILCIYCSSIWLGILFMIGYYVNNSLTIIVSLPFAISALAIAVNERIMK